MLDGFGALLKRGDGAVPENFTTIAEISNLSAPISREEIDGTHHTSPGGWREFKPGLKQAEFSFEGNYLPADPSHNASVGLLADFNSGVTRNYRIEWPGTNVKWTAPAFLREFEPNAPVDDKLGMSGTFRVAGQMTLE